MRRYVRGSTDSPSERTQETIVKATTATALTRERVNTCRSILLVFGLIVAGGEFFAVQVGGYDWMFGIVLVSLAVSTVVGMVGREGLLVVMGLRRFPAPGDPEAGSHRR